MSALSRALLLTATLSLAAAGADAASLPRHVAAAFSGYVYDCQEEKQKPPKEGDFISRVDDLDGDGKPDFIFDIAKGCEANRLLYCSDEGCKIAVYLSSEENALTSHSFSVKGWRLVKDQRPARIAASMSGEACGPKRPAACDRTIRFKDGAMVAE